VVPRPEQAPSGATQNRSESTAAAARTATAAGSD
jgi:hypothetical protein